MSTYSRGTLPNTLKTVTSTSQVSEEFYKRGLIPHLNAKKWIGRANTNNNRLLSPIKKLIGQANKNNHDLLLPILMTDPILSLFAASSASNAWCF